MEYYCHYTTLDACLNILNSAKKLNNRDLSITFWGSSMFYMNDPQEFYYGFNTLWPLLKEVENKLHIDNNLRVSNIWKESHLEGSEAEINNKVLNALYESNQTPFVISFSLCNDSLPLWNMYSNKGRGACFVFVNGEHEFTTPDGRIPVEEKEIEKSTKVHIIKEVSFQNVAYDAERSESKQYLKHLIEIYYKVYANAVKQQNANSFNLKLEILIGIFTNLSPLIKNKSYEYEHEVRIIQTEKDINNIKTRCNANGKLIPYVEIHIPIKHLRNIVIGPACDFNATRNAIQTRLSQLGINNIKITKSEVPYRIY